MQDALERPEWSQMVRKSVRLCTHSRSERFHLTADESGSVVALCHHEQISRHEKNANVSGYGQIVHVRLIYDQVCGGSIAKQETSSGLGGLKWELY